MSFFATKFTNSIDRARVHCEFRQNVLQRSRNLYYLFIFFFVCVALFSTHLEPLSTAIMIELIVSDKLMGGKSVRNDIYVAQIDCFSKLRSVIQ